MVAVSVSGLSKSFGPLRVLKDIDLPIEAGDFIWTPPGESHTLHAETEVVIHVVLPGPVVVTE